MNSHGAPSAFPGVWLPPQLDPFNSMLLTACISQSQSSVMTHNPSVAGPAPDVICFFLTTSAWGFPPCQCSGIGLKASVAVRPSGSLNRGWHMEVLISPVWRGNVFFLLLCCQPHLTARESRKCRPVLCPGGRGELLSNANPHTPATLSRPGPILLPKIFSAGTELSCPRPRL